MQLGGSIYGNLLAGSNLRHPLKIPSGYSSGFLDSLRLNILPQLSTSNCMSSAQVGGPTSYPHGRHCLPALAATGAGVIATANPGGHLQLVNGLRTRGETPNHVTHPLVLQAEAYRPERPPDGTDPLDGGNRPAARRIDR